MNSKCAWWLAPVAGLAAAAFTPVVLRAPKPAMNLPRDVRDLHEALEDCLESRLDGWELVDFATRLVNEKFTRYSVWHLWENSGLAFKNSRGFSEQYNLGLARILSGLGYDVQGVHARHVRFEPDRPGTAKWRNGHTWLRVSYHGETLGALAIGSFAMGTPPTVREALGAVVVLAGATVATLPPPRLRSSG